ncbi:hypothetical protein ACI3KY_00815 [Microbacterium sp. ZW T2_14]|uniref:hypothetical protein n=1 Tax=Microbacterium sp. ZW T2_14 TaxID=3378079 RepID=UPI00385421B3
MPVRSRSLIVAAGIALLAAGLLTACATPAGSGGTPSSSATTQGDDSDEQEVGAAWLDGGRMIGIVTQGSSTCVPTAEEATYSNGVMKVTLVEAAGTTACTRDLVPRVSLVGTPEGVDPADGVEIEVTTAEGMHGDTDLEGVPDLAVGGETDYLPSAGWTDVDGQFVILSWGSSTCAPVIENTEATGANEVTVTFVTPPASQVCTMDMAPRGVVTAVNGLEDEDADTFAILTGAEFDNVRIPIYPN